MKKWNLWLLLSLLLSSCSLSRSSSGAVGTDCYCRYVDVKIGSGGHGHVFVGASVPFGMVQLGPTSVPQSWDWCSGYHDSDSTVIGFSHTHLEGTGIGDLFDVTVMPVVGSVTYARGTENDTLSGLWSYGERSKEVAVPGYYSIPLTRYRVLAELTTTNRVGFHRYTFPASEESALVFDLQDGGGWDRVTETRMTVEGNQRIVGYRYSKGWAANQKVYFVAEFSKPFDTFELQGADSLFGRASFKTSEGEQILLKVALSPVSIEGARANLAAELAGWDFEAVRDAAVRAWDTELRRIRVVADDEEALTKFYTALYHTMIVPATFSDVDGKYRGADNRIHHSSQPQYTILSLWDTYRAEMPLLSLFQRKKSGEIVNSMLDICEQQGRLPVWHLWGNETNCMVGNPGIIAVADAIVKELPGVDCDRAYKALLATAADTARGGTLREKYGYIPCDLMLEGVAFDMEYAIADGAIARAAEALGDTAGVRRFTERSHSYRNYFDAETGFIRGRMADGSWRTPFDPNSTTHRQDDYCEGNAWQYTWLVPQDLAGLEQCFGSRQKTIEKLDLLFTTSSELTGDDVSPDISGLIGQYAHGNEPVHHVIYFYSMLGRSDRAAERVRQVLNDYYTTGVDGLSGNEDAGQMSAWYVLSAMGFYQPEPASGRFWFGSPVLDEVEMDVPGGTFTIRAINNSAENIYIQSVRFRGKDYALSYILYKDIMEGGVLEFTMGPKPVVR